MVCGGWYDVNMNSAFLMNKPFWNSSFLTYHPQACHFISLLTHLIDTLNCYSPYA